MSNPFDDVLLPPAHLSLPVVLPDDDGIRSAGSSDSCFYCNQGVGQPHLADCVILKRRVLVRYSFVLEIEVPHRFDAHDVEFHRNESSWCADNALDDLAIWLEARKRQCRCLCDDFECEVLAIPEVAPFRRDSSGKVVP